MLFRSVEPGLYGAPGGDRVRGADAGVGGRLGAGDLPQARVLHDDGAGAGHVVAPEPGGPVEEELNEEDVKRLNKYLKAF